MDARLEERIERRLAWDRELAPYQLQVEVNDGIVNLKGTVATAAESHRARRIADSARGVAGVVNAVAVDPVMVPFAGTQLDRPDDGTLRERIRASLAGDPEVVPDEIEIQVDDGHVTLSGQVPDVAQKARAERITRSLYGVRSLSNRIQSLQP